MAGKESQPAWFVVVLVVVMVAALTVHASAMPSKRRKTLRTIRELNREGPYLGLITVYSPEETSFFMTGAFKPHPVHPFVDLAGKRFRVGKIHGKSVIYVRCGIGTRNAAAATQQMLDLFDILGLVHFGISGNANNSLSVGDVVIPKQFAETGIWDWLKPNGTLGSTDVAHMDVGRYNIPKGEESNLLGRIAYSTEEFYSEAGKPNVAERLVWVEVTRSWFNLATTLEGIKLERCLNSSVCLPNEPKLVTGLKGSTANMFVDNAAYRDFLFQTFEVSSLDMESVTVVMTSLSNGYPVIVIRGMSDLAGAQEGESTIGQFGTLAALNVAKAVIQFIKLFPGYNSSRFI